MKSSFQNYTKIVSNIQEQMINRLLRLAVYLLLIDRMTLILHIKTTQVKISEINLTQLANARANSLCVRGCKAYRLHNSVVTYSHSEKVQVL